MEKIVYWKAEDGTLFLTEKDCIEHELLQNDMYFVNDKFEKVTYNPFIDGREFFEKKCYGFYVGSDKGAAKLAKLFEEWRKSSYFDHPFRGPSTAKRGHYYWDDDFWVRLETSQEEIQKWVDKFKEVEE